MTVYRFDRFVFDSAPGTLLRDEQEIKLRPQTAQILHFVLEHRGELIAKATLVEGVWGESFVNDQAIFQCINQLRKALGEEAANPRYLKTVPRRGYEWIYEPVEEGGPQPVVQPQALEDPQVQVQKAETETAPRGKGWLKWVFVAGLLVLVAALAYRLKPVKEAVVAEKARERIAFVPFHNGTGDASYQWVELGLMDMVAKALSNDPKAGPVATGRVLDALRQCGITRGTVLNEERATNLRETLGVKWVIQVSVGGQRDDFLMRYQAHGDTDLERKRQISGKSLTEMAHRLASELGHVFQTSGLPAHAFSKDSFVNESYALGVHEMGNGYEKKAKPYFEICIRKDPNFLWAGYQLAACHMFLGDLKAAMEVSRTYLTRALAAKDISLTASLYQLMGNLAYQLEKPDEALDYFTEGLAVWRGLGDREGEAIALVDMGMMLIAGQRSEEAYTHFERALEITRQLNDEYATAAVYGQLGAAYMDTPRHKEGMAHLEEEYRLWMKLDEKGDASYALLNLGFARHSINNLAGAEQSFKKALELARQIEHKPSGLQALLGLGELAIEQDKWPDARHYLHEGLTWALELENPVDELSAHLSFAKLGAQLKDEELVFNSGNRAIALAKKVNDTEMLIEAWSHFGDYYLNRGNLEGAKTYLDQVWAHHQEKTNPIALLLMARYQYETGLFREALENQTRVKAEWPQIWDRREENYLNLYREAAGRGE